MGIPVNINGKDYYNKEEARAVWFEEWLMKQDFVQDLIDREKELEYRRTHPDWNTPYVMYGVRKKHKCIQKKEIAVFYDLIPRQKRARTAETHWYKVLYKRIATPEEVEALKTGTYTRRYLVYSLYIAKKMTLDKALSLIIADDKLLGVPDITISEIVKAFDCFFNRKFRIYKPEFSTQLKLFVE
ncbi:hypothetical protein [Bacteroides fragilis]|jgi:hypothetical protein bacD2_02120|uniref:hypothetical protein n=1 Tax=Bacteroides fragilis TaxID=817 RepID=UPI00101BCA8F|nr:hypothetical protein [Bacteroides fragilis]MBA5650842.1 hypothetical protein [Bacteroides fragilis]MCE9401877.1 hypothetical protein [Bacteroides fragilis]MCZ2501371.1 hypothetical protein [Bacteroides fragilis]